MKAIGTLAENVQQQVYLAGGLTGHKTKNTPTPNRCWRMKREFNLVVENAKTAAGNHRRDIAAAETERRVRVENGVIHQAGTIAVGIRWIFRQDHATPRIRFVAHVWIRINAVGGSQQRIVAGNRKRRDLVNTNGRSREAAVKAANKTGGKAGICVLPQRGLLHGAMYLTPAEEFSGIQHAAAKLLFWPGATRHQRHRTRQREEIQNTHKSFVCLMRLPSLP